MLENMRRGCSFEIQVSKPRVLFKEEDGIKKEPIELAIVDVDESFTGTAIEKNGTERLKWLFMVQGQDGYTRLELCSC